MQSQSPPCSSLSRQTEPRVLVLALRKPFRKNPFLLYNAQAAGLFPIFSVRWTWPFGAFGGPMPDSFKTSPSDGFSSHLACARVRPSFSGISLLFSLPRFPPREVSKTSSPFQCKFRVQILRRSAFILSLFFHFPSLTARQMAPLFSLIIFSRRGRGGGFETSDHCSPLKPSPFSGLEEQPQRLRICLFPGPLFFV